MHPIFRRLSNPTTELFLFYGTLHELESFFEITSMAKDHWWRSQYPIMRIWSILLIKSDLKWCIHLNRSLFLYFNLLGECHCWWTNESPRAHVAKFYGRLRLIRSVWESASKFPAIKLFEIVILWVYYIIPFGFSLFWHVLDISFHTFEITSLAKDHWWRFQYPKCAYGPYC